MIAHTYKSRDVSYLDKILLDATGQLQVVDASVYQGIPWEDLRIWCHLHAVYGLPTTELVHFLGGIIGERKAIEVGSGNGCLGRALGIPRTDSCCQNRLDVKLYYLAQGQPTIDYPSDVEELDALAAIERYKPEVVIGSWVTQTSDGSRPGCVYGLDEEAILAAVPTYIVFGSVAVHGGANKAINQKPHRIVRMPWMWSRAHLRDSALFIWSRE